MAMHAEGGGVAELDLAEQKWVRVDTAESGDVARAVAWMRRCHAIKGASPVPSHFLGDEVQVVVAVGGVHGPKLPPEGCWCGPRSEVQSLRHEIRLTPIWKG